MEWKHGGQYGAYRERIFSLFDSLTRHNVQPIFIVFDGIDPDDKLKNLIERKNKLQTAIVDAINGMEGREQQEIVPPLIKETFSKCVDEYNTMFRSNVRMYAADGEADTLSMMIANSYNSFLIAEDSDYYIASL